MSTKQRNIGQWDREELLISDGSKIKKGDYVMTDHFFLGSFLGQVQGILHRPNEEPVADVREFGSEYSALFKSKDLRRATYSEFRWNRTGFGKTPWRQFWIIVALFTIIALAGAFSMGAYWWVMPTFYALCWGVVELKTYHNYTGRTV